MNAKVVKIGGASGAWGDSPMAIGQLLREDVQYLMMDFLAEVTMSLLARARMKDPEAGFPPDFVGYLKPHLAGIARRGIKVVSNGGGVNPLGCMKALQAVCKEQGLPLKIAVVTGDDLLPQVEQLRAEGVTEWVSGEPLPAKLLTANAYFGALPVAAALARGADIVITGRCADSALALGALMHEFGWAATDYDRLAAGSLVGHLLECGPQCTGGIFTDWRSVPRWHDIGYPIAECRADGSCVIAKPRDTGGIVTTATVAEQTLYEIGDPRAYVLPDVVADFSNVRLTQEGPDRVHVDGARGRPPTPQYKVSATWADGFRAVAMIAIVGMEAAAKAQRTANALVERARMQFRERKIADFRGTHVEVLGAEASYGAGSRAGATREAVLRLVVEHQDPKALELFAREIGMTGLGFAQGTAAMIGGRPKAAPVVRLFTFFVGKERLAARVQLGDGEPFEVAIPSGVPFTPDAPPPQRGEAASGATVEVPLIAVAHARSGDKGDSSNIAIFCRDPAFAPHLRAVLTPERVAAHFAGLVGGPVVRYEAPGLAAFNFLLQNALGGGGMASSRIDPLGKAYGQRLLELRVPVPAGWKLHEPAAVPGSDS